MRSPLPVVLGAVINRNNILLIRKNKSLFTDLWGLPSSKIQSGENIDQAVLRGIKEKTNIDAKYEGLLASISEVLAEAGSTLDHFLIFLCKLQTDNYSYNDSPEGKLRWFSLDEIDNYKQIMIPSDFEMIKKIVLDGNQGNFNSLIEKTNSNYELKKFERF